MGTNSNIIYFDGATETYHYSYCHWDGHIDTNGKTLKEHYNTVDKVKALIALGSISSLGELLEAPNGKPHSFNSPCENVTVAYHRDRGDDLELETSGSLLSIPGREYNYLFKDGTWKVAKNKCRNFREYKV